MLNRSIPLTRLPLWGTNSTSDQRSQLGPAAELRNESEPNWAIGRESSRRLGWARGNWNEEGATVLRHSVSRSRSWSRCRAHFSQSAVKNLPIYDPLKTKN